MITFNEKYCENVLKKGEIDKYILDNEQLLGRAKASNLGLIDCGGWIDVNESAGNLEEYKKIAKKIDKDNSCLIVVGVGGSNRSALSLIEGLGKNNNKIYYGGNNLSSQSFIDLMDSLKDRNYYVNIIAKNFHTLEPSIAFRFLREKMKEKYGDNFAKRIILTGSYGKGQLYDISKELGCTFFEFPKEVGGRFSAFTSVGLLPMCVAGVDIDKFVESGINCQKELEKNTLLEDVAIRYGVTRTLLQKKGFLVEGLAVFEPRLENLAKWWLQLHGESEGKCEQSILPIILNYSEDLHAIGQYIQQGRRFISETFLKFLIKTDKNFPQSDIVDGLEYLDGKKYDSVNQAVYDGTLSAHFSGGIPIMQFEGDGINEENMAQFMYINMRSAYYSSLLIGVEPFDQMGVEAYKTQVIKILNQQ